MSVHFSQTVCQYVLRGANRERYGLNKLNGEDGEFRLYFLGARTGFYNHVSQKEIIQQLD